MSTSRELKLETSPSSTVKRYSPDICIEEILIVDEKVSHTWSLYKYVIFYCALIAFGGFSMGYDVGVISGVVNMPDFIDRFGEMNLQGIIELTDIRIGMFVSLYYIGCCFGSLILSKIGDTHGRRIGLMVSSVIYAIGNMVQAISHTAWYQFLIGRIIAGIAVGSITVLCPMYIAESSPNEIKGNTVFGFQANVVFGVFVAAVVNYNTELLSSSNQWRIPIGLGVAWGALFGIGMIFTPESPLYLIDNEKVEAARSSIAKFNNLPSDDSRVNQQVILIEGEVALLKASGNGSWKDLITGQPKIFLRVVIGMIIQILNQLSGINYFFFFGVKIFKEVGVDAYLTAIILGTTNILGTLLGLIVVEKLGRRKLLIGGAIGMSICFLIFSTVGSFGLYYEGHSGPTKFAGGCAMIFVANLNIFIYAATFGGCIFTVIAVLYPLHIRTKAISLSTVQLYLWGFALGMSTTAITSKINFFLGFVFFGCLVVSIGFIYYFIPETKGLGFQDVDEMYQQGIPAWRSASWIPSSKLKIDNEGFNEVTEEIGKV